MLSFSFVIFLYVTYGGSHIFEEVVLRFDGWEEASFPSSNHPIVFLCIFVGVYAPARRVFDINSE